MKESLDWPRKRRNRDRAPLQPALRGAASLGRDRRIGSHHRLTVGRECASQIEGLRTRLHGERNLLSVQGSGGRSRSTARKGSGRLGRRSNGVGHSSRYGRIFREQKPTQHDGTRRGGRRSTISLRGTCAAEGSIRRRAHRELPVPRERCVSLRTFARTRTSAGCQDCQTTQEQNPAPHACAPELERQRFTPGGVRLLVACHITVSMFVSIMLWSSECPLEAKLNRTWSMGIHGV